MGSTRNVSPPVGYLARDEQSSPAQDKITDWKNAGKAWIHNNSGSEFLDFTSTGARINAGYGDELIINSVADALTPNPSVVNGEKSHWFTKATEDILSITDNRIGSCVLTNGFCDSVTIAVNTAKRVTGRDGVAVLADGMFTEMGRQRENSESSASPEAMMPGMVTFPFPGPFPYRPMFGEVGDTQAEEEGALQALEFLFRMRQRDIAAVLVDPQTSASGVTPLSQSYLEGVHSLCQRFGALLIVDESTSGFQRCGSWFMSLDLMSSTTPDLIVFSDNATSRYVPVGGVLARPGVKLDSASVGALQTSNTAAFAAVSANIASLDDAVFGRKGESVGDGILGPRLVDLAAKRSFAGEVRGQGFSWVIELVASPKNHRPLVNHGSSISPAEQIAINCRGKGLLIHASEHRLYFSPPCVITESDIDVGLKTVAEQLEASA